ncbi:ribonuclease toxin immunity protein CdiI [Bacillus pseudomycoides]|uniref:CDI immunity protein domain-containing protein n=1 Tax=Bacillus pseudomycoides TaxID=64104 RepID=A0ABD6T2V0_9BACI|nr:ribonuclease toxin immunity protein CdiI [Bacillus pseudomycoides]PDZ11513.1 hypothetical protein CON70_11160 [Bacillus pseudomycoides]PEP70744.1 hypothetical protein CN584_31015 [Bacillus pseudomycoides]PHE86299.1 hypothetical protein COF81_28385 [Bacillus pseudomycoides]
MQESKKEELLKRYYSHIGDGYFLDALNNFSNRQGFGIEDIWCVFANEYEPWEEDYFGETGVAYYFDYPAIDKDEVLTLDKDSFYKYLLDASEDYLTRNLTDEQKVKKHLKIIKRKLHITQIK